MRNFSPQIKKLRKYMLLAQGIYYFITGLWPIIHIGSFMMVTGYKTDLWLVKMVGLLSISISIQLIAQVVNKRLPRLLGLLSALAFLSIDSYYTLNGTISKIYLADAAIQVIFIIVILLPVSNPRKS